VFAAGRVGGHHRQGVGGVIAHALHRTPTERVAGQVGDQIPHLPAQVIDEVEIGLDFR
jgi:hypothetical protein